MVYAVYLPEGMPNYDFEAYLRLLEQAGIDVARAPRVRDPVSDAQWLYAWSDAQQAAAFALRLREETEHDGWQVLEFADADQTFGPLGRVEIIINRQGDGCTYSLTPSSWKLISKSFPGSKLTPSVFIATPTPFDLERDHGPIWEQVAKILTGLNAEQIAQVGGYRVIERRDRRVLRDVAIAG